MASKKAKEEVAQSQQQQAEASNRETKIDRGADLSMDDFNNSPYNDEAAEAAIALLNSMSDPKPKKEEHKPLHVLAADRLNQLIDEANSLDITDIVQILNSDRTAQFYMVYRA